MSLSSTFALFFFNDTATTETYTYGHTLSLHDALPIYDGEQVGEGVAKHVASDADRVLAAADAFERHRHRLDRRQDADVQALSVMVLQVILDLARRGGVVRALRVEPEHRRRAAQARAVDRELHPVPDRRVPGLAHAPDVAGVHLVRNQRVAGLVEHAHGAVGGDAEGLVVAAVFLGLLRHQADVGHAAHGRR